MRARVRIRGCGTILSSVDCKYGLPAGELGNRQQINEADLQRQRIAIISKGGNGGKASPVSRSVFELMKIMYETNQRWRHNFMCCAH